MDEGGSEAGIPGDLGGSWTSGKGGGDGRRGEVAGERGAGAVAVVIVATVRMSNLLRA